MAAATEGAAAAGATTTNALERNSRSVRWLHAGVYLTTFTALGTGWWLLAGREGRPTPVARALAVSDVTIHEYAGWALLVVAVIGAVLGPRATRLFFSDSVRFRRSERTWFARWPRALLTGRFGFHEGHFDPGQRIANLVIVGLLVALVGSGIGLTAVHGGPAFVWLLKIHRATTYAFTVVIAGHVILGAGLLPGYRGVWRAMHGRGRVSEATARRLWPAWARDRLGD